MLQHLWRGVSKSLFSQASNEGASENMQGIELKVGNAYRKEDLKTYGLIPFLNIQGMHLYSSHGMSHYFNEKPAGLVFKKSFDEAYGQTIEYDFCLRPLPVAKDLPEASNIQYSDTHKRRPPIQQPVFRGENIWKE